MSPLCPGDEVLVGHQRWFLRGSGPHHCYGFAPEHLEPVAADLTPRQVPPKDRGVREGSAHHFGENTSGPFPQIVVHITRRFQAHGFLGHRDRLLEGHGADDLLDLRDVVRRHAQLAQPQAQEHHRVQGVAAHLTADVDGHAVLFGGPHHKVGARGRP